MSAGSRSRRVESTWPNLTKIGPSVSSAWRRRTALCRIAGASAKRGRNWYRRKRSPIQSIRSQAQQISHIQALPQAARCASRAARGRRAGARAPRRCPSARRASRAAAFPRLRTRRGFRRCGAPRRHARRRHPSPARRGDAPRRRRRISRHPPPTSQRRWRARNITSLASLALPATSIERSRWSSPFTAAASALGLERDRPARARPRAGAAAEPPVGGDREAQRAAAAAARSSRVSAGERRRRSRAQGSALEQVVQCSGKRGFESQSCRKTKGHRAVAFRPGRDPEINASAGCRRVASPASR